LGRRKSQIIFQHLVDALDFRAHSVDQPCTLVRRMAVRCGQRVDFRLNSIEV
jgi:hypothetical protein